MPFFNIAKNSPISALEKEFQKLPKEGKLYRHPASNLVIEHKGDLGCIYGQEKYWSKLADLTKSHTAPESVKLLDIGAYIGDSVWYFLVNRKITNNVISVEPDPRNIELFQKNWEGDKRVELIQAAVVGDNRKTVNLYLGRTYSGANTLQPLKGRKYIEVPAIHYLELFDRNPQILKGVMAGAEYQIDWKKLPDSVQTIGLEISHIHSSWIELGRKLDQDLLNMGFHHVVAPKHRPTHFAEWNYSIWTRLKEH